jgi:hypothetical protein
MVPIGPNVTTSELSSQARSLGPPIRKLGGPIAWGPTLKNGIPSHGVVQSPCSRSAWSRTVGLHAPPLHDVYLVSAFRTREDHQPSSKFVSASPCPDGLMQDGTQVGNVAYVISHRGARSRGYKCRETSRARARGRRLALSVL